MDYLHEFPRLSAAILVAALLALQTYPIFNPSFKNLIGKLFIPLQLCFACCVGVVLLLLLASNIEIFVNNMSNTISDIHIDWLFGLIPKPSFTDIIWATYGFISIFTTSFLSYAVFVFLNIPLLLSDLKAKELN